MRAANHAAYPIRARLLAALLIMTQFRTLTIIATLLLSNPVAAAELQSPSPPGLHFSGEALKTVLPKLGMQLGVQLTVHPELENQRVTLFGRGRTVPEVKEDLRELLTPSAEAPVFWARVGSGDSWRLEQSKNRRELAATLAASGAESYRQFLNEELDWVRKSGLDLYANSSGPQQNALKWRILDPLLIDCLGVDRQDRLFKGEPVVLTGQDIQQSPHGDLLRDWMVSSFRFSPDASGRPANFGQYSYVFVFSKSPDRPTSDRPVISVVIPSGFVAARKTLRGSPKLIPSEDYLVYLQDRLMEMGEQETANTQQVSFCLTPEPKAPPGTFVWRTFDQLFDVVSRETGVNIVADGYLRAPKRLPANLMIHNCPLDRLLTQLTYAWECGWHYSKRDKNVIIIRAKNWWMEDRANVPQAKVEELSRRFAPGRNAELTDLMFASQLSEAQGNKLRQARVVPGLPELDSEAFHDDANARATLRFLSQLTGEQQAQASSPSGLLLTGVSPVLRQRFLDRTMILGGAVQEDVRRRSVLFVKRKNPQEDGHTRAWLLELKDPQGGFDYGQLVVVPKLQPTLAN